MIEILVVDDSKSARDYLSYLLDSDPEIRVIGQAENGKAALDCLKSMKPDVIVMDLIMPVMDGFAATRSIMETRPRPIVIISSAWEPMDVEKTFKAMEAGAVSILRKPSGYGTLEAAQSTGELIAAVKQAALVTPRKLRPKTSGTSEPARHLIRGRAHRNIELVALGASTGGPIAIQQFLAGLHSDLSIPILIVQHIAVGFTQGLADWLNLSSPLPVHVARQGEPVLGGHVHIAPEGHHMGVSKGRTVVLARTPPEHSVRPSVSYLFRSVAKVYGKDAAGILLSGMGVDGAAELKLIKDAGGITFAQDFAGSAVHGMPGEAIRLGAADHVMPPEKMAVTLVELLKTRH